jgi:hypothetical protein
VADEPSLGEVLRRLDDVARQMTALALQMRDDRLEAAATFVRQDVYTANTIALTTRVTKIEADDEAKEKDAAAFRRQLLFIILAVAIPAIASLLLAVNNFLAAGGAS